jgi:hypothetical protein
MKTILYLFVMIVAYSTCKAQQNVDSLRYYSKGCGGYDDYIRDYLNDSMYAEQNMDVIDTLVLRGSSLFRVIRNGKYKIIDVEEDFKNHRKTCRYFYLGLSPDDTLQRKNETALHWQWRIEDQLVIYVPIREVEIEGRTMYVYYITDECSHHEVDCIQSKIANRQYGVVYFEPGMGFVGHGGDNEKCISILTKESYQLLEKRRVNHLNKSLIK